MSSSSSSDNSKNSKKALVKKRPKALSQFKASHPKSPLEFRDLPNPSMPTVETNPEQMRRMRRLDL